MGKKWGKRKNGRTNCSIFPNRKQLHIVLKTRCVEESVESISLKTGSKIICDPFPVRIKRCISQNTQIRSTAFSPNERLEYVMSRRVRSPASKLYQWVLTISSGLIRFVCQKLSSIGESTWAVHLLSWSTGTGIWQEDFAVRRSSSCWAATWEKATIISHFSFHLKHRWIEEVVNVFHVFREYPRDINNSGENFLKTQHVSDLYLPPARERSTLGWKLVSIHYWKTQ